MPSDNRIQTYSNGLVLSASLAANGASIALIPALPGEQRTILTRLPEPFQ